MVRTGCAASACRSREAAAGLLVLDCRAHADATARVTCAALCISRCRPSCCADWTRGNLPIESVINCQGGDGGGGEEGGGRRGGGDHCAAGRVQQGDRWGEGGGRGVEGGDVIEAGDRVVGEEDQGGREEGAVAGRWVGGISLISSPTFVHFCP